MPKNVKNTLGLDLNVDADIAEAIITDMIKSEIAVAFTNAGASLSLANVFADIKALMDLHLDKDREITDVTIDDYHAYTVLPNAAKHTCWNDPDNYGNLYPDTCAGCAQAALMPCRYCGYGHVFNTHNPQSHSEGLAVVDVQVQSDKDITDEWSNSPHVYEDMLDLGFINDCYSRAMLDMLYAVANQATDTESIGLCDQIVERTALLTKIGNQNNITL